MEPIFQWGPQFAFGPVTRADGTVFPVRDVHLEPTIPATLENFEMAGDRGIPEGSRIPDAIRPSFQKVGLG